MRKKSEKPIKVASAPIQPKEHIGIRVGSRRRQETIRPKDT